MNIPAIEGVIRRRILLNYRVDPEVVQGVLPANFRPKLVGGYAIAGICLIRLEGIRPKGLGWLPEVVGISSENSAHRVAVEWDSEDGGVGEGVFVPRRDTDSLMNSLAGGRVFSGVHHHSEFRVMDEDGEISLRIDANDHVDLLVDLRVRETGEFPSSSVFGSLSESSRFFEGGCIGYSSRPGSCELDGLLLKVDDWQVSALDVEHVASAFYDDTHIFPTGSIELDHALLMRDIPHEWHSEPMMRGG